MKRLRNVFALTVWEQRVIIALLLAWVLFVAYDAHRSRRIAQPPSPSPGMGP